MDPTPDAPQLPISEPIEQPSGGDQVGGMMARFTALKESGALDGGNKPAETQKPAETPSGDQPDNKPEPSGDPTEPQEPKQRAKWGELKTKAQERDDLVTNKLPALERELAELREKAANLEKVDPTRYEAQIAEKEKALEDYEKRLAVYDIRESKPFKEQVEMPLRNVAKVIDRVASSYGVDPAPIKMALAMPDLKAQREELAKLMDGMDPADQAEIRSQAIKAHEVYEKAAEIEANAATAKKELEFIKQQEEENKKKERSETLTRTSKAVQERFLQVVPLLKDDPELAKDVFSAQVSDDPAMSVYNAMSGKLVAALVRREHSQAAKIAELEKELATRSALSPKGGGGGSQVPAESPNNGQPQGNSLWERGKSMGLVR